MQRCRKTAKRLQPVGRKKINEGIAIFGGLSIAKPALEKLFNEVKGMMVYTINLELYHQSLGKFVEKYFKHIPDCLATISSPEYDNIHVNIHSAASEYIEKNMDVYDYAMVEGIPTQIHINWNSENGRRRTVEVSTLRINNYPERLRKFLKHFIITVDEELRVTGKKEVVLVDPYNRDFISVDNVNRNFQNVFIPDAIINEITSSIDSFCAKKDWYNEHGLPYHFGIMLHGDAGMGKSSIAQAIASYMNANLYVLSGDSVMGLPRAIRMISRDTIRYATDFDIILVEDIDCGLGSETMTSRLSKYMMMTNNDDNRKQETSDSNDMHLGLASVLNALDGVGSPSNMIFIFTTNHIDKLDSALIRPGRIDLSLEIKPVCLESFGKFMRHHYGDEVHIPKNLSIRDNLSFAELQTLVMKGYSADKLIEFVKNKKTKKYSSTPVKFGEIEPEKFAKLKKGKE